ncbi:hypothetical protein TeGR_g5805, partial [Tetraparma gracilis]
MSKVNRVLARHASDLPGAFAAAKLKYGVAFVDVRGPPPGERDGAPPLRSAVMIRWGGASLRARVVEADALEVPDNAAAGAGRVRGFVVKWEGGEEETFVPLLGGLEWWREEGGGGGGRSHGFSNPPPGYEPEAGPPGPPAAADPPLRSRVVVTWGSSASQTAAGVVTEARVREVPQPAPPSAPEVPGFVVRWDSDASESFVPLAGGPRWKVEGGPAGPAPPPPPPARPALPPVAGAVNSLPGCSMLPVPPSEIRRALSAPPPQRGGRGRSRRAEPPRSLGEVVAAAAEGMRTEASGKRPAKEAAAWKMLLGNRWVDGGTPPTFRSSGRWDARLLADRFYEDFPEARSWAELAAREHRAVTSLSRLPVWTDLHLMVVAPGAERQPAHIDDDSFRGDSLYSTSILALTENEAAAG